MGSLTKIKKDRTRENPNFNRRLDMKNIKSAKFYLALFVLIVTQIACALLQRGNENIVLPDEADIPENVDQQEIESVTETPIEPGLGNNSENNLIELIFQIPPNLSQGGSQIISKRYFIFDSSGKFVHVWEDYAGSTAGGAFFSLSIDDQSIREVALPDGLFDRDYNVFVKTSTDGKYVALINETASWGRAIIVDTSSFEVTDVSLWSTPSQNAPLSLDGSGWVPNTYNLYIPYADNSWVIYNPFEAQLVNSIGQRIGIQSFLKWNYDESRLAIEAGNRIRIFDNGFSLISEYDAPEVYTGSGSLNWSGKNNLIVSREVPDAFSYTYYVMDSETGTVTSQFTLEGTGQLIPNPIHEVMIGFMLDPDYARNLVIADIQGNVLQKIAFEQILDPYLQWNKQGDMFAFLDNEKNIQVWKMK